MVINTASEYNAVAERIRELNNCSVCEGRGEVGDYSTDRMPCPQCAEEYEQLWDAVYLYHELYVDW